MSSKISNDVSSNISNLSNKYKNKVYNDYDNKVSKFDILLINKGWNSENEKLLLIYGQSSTYYKLAHEKASSKYELYNKIFSLSLVIINGSLSTYTSFNDNKTQIIQRLLIYVVTLISVVNNFLKFQELSSNHKNSAKRYSKLSHDIEQQTCLYKKDRPNALKYIKEISTKLDLYNSSSPLIPNSISKELRKNGIIIQNLQKVNKCTEENNKLTNINNTSENNENNVNNENILPISCDKNTIENINTYNLLQINGDITEDDANELNEYLKKISNDAKLNFEFNRWRE